jgi:hypothetical protein
MIPVLVSHKTVNWPTPKKLYGELDAEFHFDYDPCPLRGRVGPLFGADGLYDSWAGRRVFCNPPFGPGIPKFIAKAREADLAVFLVPARTDTRWFHDIVLPHAKEIRFIRGRLKSDGEINSWPCPAMVLIFSHGTVDGAECPKPMG